MWRLWTRGWGPRGWWYWMRHDRAPMAIAWALPRTVVYWAVIRMAATSGDGQALEGTVDQLLKNHATWAETWSRR